MYILGDGHVHLHPSFQLGGVFEAAATRARSLGGPFFLLLAEVQGIDVFRALREQAEGSSTSLHRFAMATELPSSLRLERTGEAVSLRVRSESEAEVEVYVIAGCQLVSNEGIEVLAIAPPRRDELPADRSASARELVDAVRAQGAVAVLPWGLGKWLGAPGARVDSLVRAGEWARDPLFLLGDTAHRFWPWPEPHCFRDHGRVLAGTDPLPIRGAERRVGQYGFRIAGELAPRHPARSLVEAIRSGAAIGRIGAPHGATRVFADQILYRWAGRRAVPSNPP